MTTDVALTFDIEFDVNGTFGGYPHRKPAGAERFSIGSNNGGLSGLDRILQSLAAHDIRATFFIETLQTAWFGMEEMGAVAQKIASAGHELQLHLHPVWLLFDDPHWQEKYARNPPRARTHDSLVPLDADRCIEIISRGLGVFREWNLPAPTVVRTGSLVIEPHLYRSFARCGLRFSSSVGLGIYLPRVDSLHRYSTPWTVDGVMELPLTSFIGVDPALRRKTRLATVIGMGRAEQRAVLRAAAQAGAPYVMILSHVSEFLREKNGRLQADSLTASKFESLCRLAREDAGYRPVTVSEIAASISATQPTHDIHIEVPRLASVSRLVDHIFPGTY